MSRRKGRSSPNTTAIDLVIVAATLIAGAAMTASARAEPSVSESWSYYSVTGSDLPTLRREMAAKGPNGYWAYAEWYVKWSASCRVSVKLTYTMPALSDGSDLSPRDRGKWDSMITALKAHEEQHGAHGLAAGREIEAANCVKPRRIIRKWNQADKRLDRETDHGARTGVTLD